MSDDVKIDPDLLESDAEEYWQDGADRLEKMNTGVPEIAAPDFSIIPGAQDVARRYVKTVAALRGYIEGGAKEYIAFETLLLKSAISYETHHNGSVEDITRLRGELGA